MFSLLVFNFNYFLTFLNNNVDTRTFVSGVIRMIFGNNYISSLSFSNLVCSNLLFFRKWKKQVDKNFLILLFVR